MKLAVKVSFGLDLTFSLQSNDTCIYVYRLVLIWGASWWDQ